MSDFNGHHFPADVILVCIRWYCKYAIRNCDLKEMMVKLWIQHYAPLTEKRIR